MSQNIFLDPNVSSPPTLTGGSVGNGTLTVDKLTHFTITQNYTAICTSVDPFTVFDIVGSLDGAIGVAIVGDQFVDQDIKIFLTINQGPILFNVGDTFEWSVEQGTDLTQTNLDTYDELPQKNFGDGVIGENKGDHNLRFSEAAQLAFKNIQDLNFESKIAGALGNIISIEYLLGSYLASAALTIQDLTYTSAFPGTIGNNIEIEYEQFDAAIASIAVIQDISYSARVPGVAGDLISIEYTGGGTAGSEVVGVIGDAVTVQIEDGVSTADEIRLAIGLFPAAFALLDGFSTGTGNEPQSIQGPTFLTGGADAIGDAGNEVVTVVSNKITVKLESGVSDAQNIFDAVVGSGAALALITPSISGTAVSTQTAPVASQNLTGGADDVGIPGSEIVTVTDQLIQITFIDGDSTAQQIKDAVEAFLAADALVTVTLLGIGTEFESSPVSRTFLTGGLGQGTYQFNTKELTDSGSFFDGNASILVKDIINQGDDNTSGTTTKNGPVILDDSEPANLPGPTIGHAQRSITSLIQNGKAFIVTENDSKISWSEPAATITIVDDIRIIFSETNIYNSIEVSNSPIAIADGEHVWVRVDRYNNGPVVITVSTTIPETPYGEDVFRLVSRYGDNLLWWDNTLQAPGKDIRIGEGGTLDVIDETPTGVINGVNKDFVLTEEPISSTHLSVFLDGLKDVDYTLNIPTKTITFTTAPELGQQVRVYYFI